MINKIEQQNFMYASKYAQNLYIHTAVDSTSCIEYFFKIILNNIGQNFKILVYRFDDGEFFLIQPLY